MNILQVCSAREIGGGERHLADIVNGLTKCGHKVYAAVSPKSPLINELTSLPRDRIVTLRMRNSLDVVSAVRLARLAREHSIHVIHAHVARDYPLAALASLRAGNVPYVLTRHVLFPMNRLHRLTLSRVSRVIAVSNAVADGLRAEGIFEADKIVTIHNGIDIEHFASRAAKTSGPSNRLRVGMLGHISPIKGQREFVEAAAIIASQLDDVDFLIVGEDKSHDGRNRAELDGLIRRLDLSERIRLAGWVDDVREVLETLDVFVSPSQVEPFGLAIVEAMASGVPVVATMSDGGCEIIEPEITGRLVPVGDTIALANAVGDLLGNIAKRESITKHALDSVRRRFSLQRMIDDTERLVYEQIIKNA